MNGLRRGLLPLMALALIGARAPLVPLPDILMPNEIQTGEPFTAKPGDVILRAKIMRTEKTYLEEAVHADIARFSGDLQSGTVLTTVLANADTRKTVGSKANAYYCGENMKARSDFMAAMVGDLGSKFENIVRFCFIDEDDDKKFDHYFLAGAKDPEFLTARPIGPLAYRQDVLVHENDADEIRLRYRKFETRTTEMHLELEITRNGAPVVFQYIVTPQHTGANEQYYRMATDPKKLAYPLHFKDVLGANIVIRSVTPEGEGTFIINRNFSTTPLKPYYPQVQYYFIYI